MANYPIFSQLEGPKIDINLFPDSYSKGIDAGNKLPSKTTAIIQGLTQGAQTGEALTQGYENIQSTALNNQIKQHAIDREPNTDEQQDAQTAIDEAHASILGSAATIAKQTESVKSQEQAAELDLQKQQVTNAAQVETQTTQFNQAFQTADPQTQAKMVLSGQYQPLFSQNKDLYRSALNSVYINNDNGVDPDTRNRIGQTLRIHQYADDGEKLAQANQAKYEAAASELYGEDWARNASERLQTTPAEAASQVEMVPHGKLVYQDGKAYKDPTTKTWALSPDAYQNAQQGKWDLITKDGQVLDNTGTITDKNKEVWSKFQSADNIHRGVYAQRQIQNEVSNSKPQQTGPGTTPSVPTFDNSKKAGTAFPNQTPKSEVEVLTNKVTSSLKLPSSYNETIAEPVAQLKEHVDTYLADPAKRNDPTLQAAYSNSVKEIAKSITDKQYDESARIRQLNSPEHVAAYNEALAANFKEFQKNLVTVGPSKSQIDAANLLKENTDRAVAINDLSKTYNPTPQLYDAYKVDTPKDLYFRSQYPVIESTINGLVRDYTSRMQAKVTSPQRTNLANQGILTQLQGFRSAVQQ